MGVQLIQTKRADRNTATFMEMRQNQVVFLIQPSVTCSSVTPNDVLHQTLATMEKVATMFVGSISFSWLLRSMSQMCNPKPRVVMYVRTAVTTIMQT